MQTTARKSVSGVNVMSSLAIIYLLMLVLANMSHQQVECDSHPNNLTTTNGLVKRLFTSNDHHLSLRSLAEVKSTSSSLYIHATAIHIDKAEFPISRLLFRLTLKLAMEAVERSLTHRRVKIGLNIRSASTCANQYAAAIAAEEYYTKRTRLLIISGCDDAIKSVSRLASTWKIPLMTAAGFSADLNDKNLHKTLIRVAFSLKTAVEFLIKILRTYKWHRLNLIVDESDANSYALREAIDSNIQHYKTGSEFNVTLNTIPLDMASLIAMGASGNVSMVANDDKWPNSITEKAVMETLRQSSHFSRVTILLIPQQFLRKFMLSAYDMGLANGRYTFINIPLLVLSDDSDGSGTSGGALVASLGPSTSPPATPGSSQGSGSSGDNTLLWRSMMSNRNSQAKQAFESLMSIYLKVPVSRQYAYFAKNLTDLASSEVSRGLALANVARNNNNRLQEATSKARQVARNQVVLNPYSASFYDCVQVYGMALNESLHNIEAEHNAERRRELKRGLHANITNLMRNRRYDNMLTGSIFINPNGDRETDYTLDDMNQMTGKYMPVMVYKSETREMERLSRIHWSSDESVGPTVDDVECQLTNTCARRPMSKFLFMLILLASPLAVGLFVMLYFVYRHLSLESQLVDYWWKIKYTDIEILDSRRKAAGDGSSSVVTSEPAGSVSGASSSRHVSARDPKSELGAPASSLTRTTSVGVSSAADVCYGDIMLGNYKLAKVALKPLAKFHQTRKLMMELRTIKTISHNNLCRFVGIVCEEPNTALVLEFCPKGSLREFFQNESLVIDWTFKCSIINDIVAGLGYLHSSSVEYHGRLKSPNCLVSSRFVVKLSDYGLHSLYDQADSISDEQSLQRKHISRAPEHIKAGSKRGSKKGDVYSFGLLLFEVVNGRPPFYDRQAEDYNVPVKQLLDEIKSKGPLERVAPELAQMAATDAQLAPLCDLVRKCIEHDPNKRLALTQVNATLRRITHGVTSKKLLQNLTERMEQYTSNLESMVDAKLAALIEEKQRSEELLYQFVPKSIASLIKEGVAVEPEKFDCVTVFFSDIVGFTSLSSESTPMQVVDFLSELYLCFDETLDQYDIFKIDIIGDAYIVASGLPQRNDGRHVIIIARAALELRRRLANFRIAHKPNKSLQMRVGIHSGPCVAGIVGGLEMPKYCVFGDTLSIGKFMESSGLPMKIHVTEESKRLLDDIGGFKIEPRTPKITKDGLQIQTYWLEDELKSE